MGVQGVDPWCASGAAFRTENGSDLAEIHHQVENCVPIAGTAILLFYLLELFSFGHSRDSMYQRRVIFPLGYR